MLCIQHSKKSSELGHVSWTVVRHRKKKLTTQQEASKISESTSFKGYSQCDVHGYSYMRKHDVQSVKLYGNSTIDAHSNSIRVLLWWAFNWSTVQLKFYAKFWKTLTMKARLQLEEFNVSILILLWTVFQLKVYLMPMFSDLVIELETVCPVVWI